MLAVTRELTKGKMWNFITMEYGKSWYFLFAIVIILFYDETQNCKFSWIYHSFNLCKWNKVHSLGQKWQAAVGSKRAIRTEENRFTALLSRIGFPAMYFTSFTGLLTTMPVLSSKPGVEKKQVRWKIQMTWFKTNKLFPSKEYNLWKILSHLKLISVEVRLGGSVG